MAKNKFKGLAVVEALIIMALSGELAWQVFLKDRFGKDPEAVTASTDVSDDPQVRTRAVI